MNEKFIDFFMTLAPTLLTSVTAFLVGRYNNFQNRPLDKMEIAYNRVYYPVYRIMKEDSIKISTVTERAKKYFCKYEKYIDRTTIMIYQQLCECTDIEEQERIYSAFSDNIHTNCVYLRKKLGYLQPGYFRIYQYLPIKIKTMIRIVFEFIVCYFCACIFSFVKIEKIRKICLVLFTIGLCTIFVEFIFLLIQKIFAFTKKNLKIYNKKQ